MAIHQETLTITSMALAYIAKMDEQIVKDLIEGRVEWAIVPVQNKSQTISKTANEKNKSQEGIKVRLQEIATREEAITYINGLNMTVPKLKQLAKELNVYVKSNDKKDIIVSRIVEGIVGSRLRSEALKYEAKKV